MGGHPEEVEADLDLFAEPAVRRAGHDRPRRARHLQRGLLEGHRQRRRRLGDHPRLREPRGSGSGRPAVPLDLRGRRLRDVPDRRAARQGARPQGVAALGRLACDRQDRGDDRHRRQHRQVHRSGRQPRRDRHQEQPGGGRGDRAPAAAARPGRHRRHRLHRHGPGVQPRPGPAAHAGVPGPRPYEAPGGRGHLAGPGPDDPQAGGPGSAGVLLRDLRPLQRPRCHRPHGDPDRDRRRWQRQALEAPRWPHRVRPARPRGRDGRHGGL